MQQRCWLPCSFVSHPTLDQIVRMIRTAYLFLAIFALSVTGSPTETSKHWAVLVAGSNTYMNYRHQADVCHSYQIMKKHGIPDENIIVMMYDDIAYNPDNPTPGIVINQPNGPNVYKGVPKDYTGEAVNPGAFLSVLQGNADAARQHGGNGKVLRSGPEDHVFVYFTDHGAPGILAFPETFLYAKDLHNAILNMHEKKMYKKMVFYVEACESGSIFAKHLLPKDISVFATTAANATQSSYACYFDDYRGTFLGDVYSVNWMQDSDKENLNAETLKKQFDVVKKETNTSRVMEFGDMTIADMTVGEFQGEQNAAVDHHPHPHPHPHPVMDAIPSEDVPLVMAEKRLARAKDVQERKAAERELYRLLDDRREVVGLFKDVVAFAQNHDPRQVHRMLSDRKTLSNFDCYQPVVDHLHRSCPGMQLPRNDFGLRHLYTLVNLCEEPTDTGVILEAISKVTDNRAYCK